MPNYVINDVKIYGTKEQIANARAVCCDMDFDKMMPIPATLNVQSGSITNQALGAYAISKLGTDSSKWTDEDVYKYAGIARCIGVGGLENVAKQTAEILKRYVAIGKVDDEHPYGSESEDISYLWTEKKLAGYDSKEPKCQADFIALGRIINENNEKYGYYDWYSWCVNTWGTKWNAMDVEVETSDEDGEASVTYRFQTAWSFPEGIADYIGEALKDLKIEWGFADEDLGNNCARLLKEAGDTEFCTLEEEELSIACDLWGYDEDEIIAEREEYGED